ncbi:cytochrome P450, partial [Lojkania enalia]
LPGPLAPKITSKWLFLHFIRGEQMNVVHDLHRKFGPIVQTGPREISFPSAQAARDIYGTNAQCVKSEIYDYMGPESLFTTRTKEKRREMKKRVAHVFAPGVLRELESSIEIHVNRLLELIEKEEGKSWDVVKPLRMLTLDISGEVLFGRPFGALGAKKLPYFVEVMKYVHPMFRVESDAPILARLLRIVPFRKIHDFAGSVEYVYGTQLLRDTISEYGRNSPRNDLLSKLINGDPKKGQAPLPDDEIANGVSNFVYAATDTTAITMTYLLYELASHPEWQKELRQELLEINGTDQGQYSLYKMVQALPILQACFSETMRLHPGIGVGLPLPMLDLQCNPQAFPSPDTYNPKRWLLTSSSKHTFSPNSGGGEYICAGSNLAIMEVKIMAAKVLQRYFVSVAGEQTHKDIEMRDHFVIETK